MNSNSQLSRKLEFAASTILSVLAPKLSRVVRVVVRFRDDADTASTDGNVVIHMPHDFVGAPIPEDAPVTLGLLAHEMGHWVQPLEKVIEIARTRGAPFWLANIALDIHSETFVENVFPAMKVPLQRTREEVRQAMLDQYRRDLADAINRNDYRDMAINASFIARTTTEYPWIVPHGPPTEVEGIRIPAWLGYFIEKMFWLFHAANVTPGELPRSFETLLDEFPELLEKDEPEAEPDDSRDDGNADGGEGDESSETKSDAQEADDGSSVAEGESTDRDEVDDVDADDENSVSESAVESADEKTGDAPDEAIAGADADHGASDEDESAETDSEPDDRSEDDSNGESDADIGESSDSSGDGGGVGSAIEDEDKGEDEERPLPIYPESDFDTVGEMLREEMQQIAQDFHPTIPTIEAIALPVNPPYPKAQQLARALQPRFQAPNSALEVAAPGRLDRMEMARGAPVPLRMNVKGHESPAIHLVLALDVSASMFSRYTRGRIWPALIAAQAVTLAVKEAGGEVAVILFDHNAYISPNDDDSLVWQSVDDLSEHFRGNTSFRFLGEVWRRWPHHQVLLVTDGESSSIPDSLPADRERTSVILIGTNTDVSAFAARSVYLSRLDRLASVLAILLPDRRL